MDVYQVSITHLEVIEPFVVPSLIGKRVFRNGNPRGVD